MNFTIARTKEERSWRKTCPIRLSVFTSNGFEWATQSRWEMWSTAEPLWSLSSQAWWFPGMTRGWMDLDGMCALGLCQWFCLRVGSDLSRRHLGRTSVFSLIWMISTHRSLFFSRVSLRVSKACASLKFMRGMADMRKIWHDTSYLSAYNSEFMWIWKLNHCCCEFLKCHWKERIASIQQPPWIASLSSPSSCCPRRVWCAYSMLL